MHERSAFWCLSQSRLEAGLRPLIHSPNLKDLLKTRRTELRASIQRIRERARAHVEPHKTTQRKKTRRRRLLLIVLLALLLFFWFSRCTCQPVTVAEAPSIAPPRIVAVPPVAKPRSLPKIKLPPIPGGMQKQDRPAYDVEPKLAPTWLDSFRLQIAARSPRLADCFRGVERPGALRFTTSVSLPSGNISDSVLEPVGGQLALSEVQKQCVLTVLSDAPYQLKSTSQETSPVPERVGIVIEF